MEKQNEIIATDYDNKPTEADINNYPYQVGDRLRVNWHTRQGRREELATVHQLHTSHQSGRTVVHCLMILCDGDTKPCAVSEEICTKLLM